MWKKSKKVLDIQENGCYYKQADAWEMKVLNAEQKNKKSCWQTWSALI